MTKITRIYWFMLVMIKAILYERICSGVCEYGLWEKFGKIGALKWSIGGGRRI